MDPALFREFCEEFAREVNRLRMEETASIAAAQSELVRVKRDIDRTIQAILDGVPGSAVKEKMGRLEARNDELTEQLAQAERSPPLLHPGLAQIYRERISSLSEAGMQQRWRSSGGDPRSDERHRAEAWGWQAGHRVAR